MTIIKHVFTVVVMLSLCFLAFQVFSEDSTVDSQPQRPDTKVIKQLKTYNPNPKLPEVENGILINNENLETKFITEALSIDEGKDNFHMQMASLAPEGLSTEINKKAKANATAINDSYYKLYEEDLPEDIHVEEPASKPDANVIKDDAPLIAIVIDDMGISVKRTKDIISLKAPLTSSFLTYGSALDKQVKQARDAGHEVMIHVPMEAKTNNDIAPDVLTTGMDNESIKFRLNNMLKKFEGIKGINNHMGSRFTENKKEMSCVMEVLKENDLFFLDSKTSDKSVGKEVAAEHDVAYIGRNVFLDNNNDFNYITGQLKTAEKLARKNGYVVAIGHPKSETYKALKEWIPTLKDKGFTLVHLSNIVSAVNNE